MQQLIFFAWNNQKNDNKLPVAFIEKKLRKMWASNQPKKTAAAPLLTQLTQPSDMAVYIKMYTCCKKIHTYFTIPKWRRCIFLDFW